MIENNATFDFYDLSVIFNPKNFNNITNDIIIKNVTIDSRKVTEGSLFIALKGEHIDGHSKIEEAFQNGAVLCFAEKNWIEHNSSILDKYPIVITDDNIDALGLLAQYHRNRFDFPIIAVCGSNGKTTTKEMIAKVLSQKYNVLKTYENYNNQIGVPLMLLSINKSYNMAVLELGTNQPGEIYKLGKITKPTHALVTNIGKEHLEFLIDLDGVEMEETAIFGEVRSGGFAFINYDDERLKLYGHVLDKFMTYGEHKDAQLNAEIKLNNNLNPKIIFNYEKNTFEINLKTIGIASAKNAISAVAVGLHFGLSFEQITNALEDFTPLLNHGYGRMALENFGKYNIINDCYNANPSSIEIALKTLQLLPEYNKKISVLGDMRELGDSSIEEHRNVIDLASSISDIVLLIGEEMSKAFEMYEFDNNVILFDSKENLVNFLFDIIEENSYILIKGSRGMKMEEIIYLFKSKISN